MQYPYVECGACRSLYCDPMPDSDTLGRMYGPSYAAGFPRDESADLRDDVRVLGWLASRPPGVFVDYGCGSGALLKEARALRWNGVGVELDARVAEATSVETGVRVVTDPGDLPQGAADAVHLGDVIEHLTRLDEQMPSILSLLKPGGFLLAQGPLEANQNLFTAVVRLARRVRRRATAQMPPYHVLLATAAGQRALFRRFGLMEERYEVTEVFWPAPAHLGFGDFVRPRRVGLHVVRRLSRWLSHLRPREWGNRYFYVGRREGERVQAEACPAAFAVRGARSA
jgi:SAM-dependent methyltransferase